MREETWTPTLSDILAVIFIGAVIVACGIALAPYVFPALRWALIIAASIVVLGAAYLALVIAANSVDMATGWLSARIERHRRVLTIGAVSLLVSVLAFFSGVALAAIAHARR